MKHLLILFIIFLMSGKCYCQPSLPAFTSAQQSQIRAYIQWQSKQSADSVKGTIINSLMPVTKGTADSLLKFASLYKSLQSKDDSIDKLITALKVRTDSAATALKLITSTIATIQGSFVTTTQTAAINASIAEVVSKQQLTADMVAILNAWMERIKVKELNFK